MKTIPRELQNLNTNSAFLREFKAALSLSEIQRKVLLGSMMGDGCLIENSSKSNYRFQTEHCDKQKSYVYWKYDIFKNFVLTPPGFHQKTKSWRFRTISHSQFAHYHKMFYSEGKKILPKDLSFLKDPLTAAVWFMDDGGRSAGGCLLNTQNFTDDEALRLLAFFRKEFKIPVTLQRNHWRYRLYIPSSHRLRWKDFLSNNMREEFLYKLDGRSRRDLISKEIR